MPHGTHWTQPINSENCLTFPQNSFYICFFDFSLLAYSFFVRLLIPCLPPSLLPPCSTIFDFFKFLLRYILFYIYRTNLEHGQERRRGHFSLALLVKCPAAHPDIQIFWTLLARRQPRHCPVHIFNLLPCRTVDRKTHRIPHPVKLHIDLTRHTAR